MLERLQSAQAVHPGPASQSRAGSQGATLIGLWDSPQQDRTHGAGQQGRQRQRGELVEGPLGRWGSPVSEPRKPRMGFFPFVGRGFETFIRRDLIVRVRFLASLTFLRLVKTRTAHQK